MATLTTRNVLEGGKKILREAWAADPKDLLGVGKGADACLFYDSVHGLGYADERALFAAEVPEINTDAILRALFYFRLTDIDWCRVPVHGDPLDLPLEVPQPEGGTEWERFEDCTLEDLQRTVDRLMAKSGRKPPEKGGFIPEPHPIELPPTQPTTQPAPPPPASGPPPEPAPPEQPKAQPAPTTQPPASQPPPAQPPAPPPPSQPKAQPAPVPLPKSQPAPQLPWKWIGLALLAGTIALMARHYLTAPAPAPTSNWTPPPDSEVWHPPAPQPPPHKPPARPPVAPTRPPAPVATPAAASPSPAPRRPVEDEKNDMPLEEFKELQRNQGPKTNPVE